MWPRILGLKKTISKFKCVKKLVILKYNTKGNLLVTLSKSYLRIEKKYLSNGDVTCSIKMKGYCGTHQDQIEWKIFCFLNDKIALKFINGQLVQFRSL